MKGDLLLPDAIDRLKREVTSNQVCLRCSAFAATRVEAY